MRCSRPVFEIFLKHHFNKLLKLDTQFDSVVLGVAPVERLVNDAVEVGKWQAAASKRVEYDTNRPDVTSWVPNGALTLNNFRREV